MKLPKHMRHIPFAISISVIIILTYFISTVTILPHLTTQLFFVFLFSLVLYIYYAENVKSVVVSTQIAALLLTGSAISLVAATGWFDSPFSFTLYLLVVILTFFFPVYVSFVYVVTLLGIVLLTINVGDWNVKFLTILSLLASIPISMYLKGIFLRLKEAEKTILILKRSHKRYRNHVEEILDNAVHRFATELRTEIGIIRQLASRLDRAQSKTKKEEEYHRLNKSIDKALEKLSHFEEEATGSQLVSKPHFLESDEQIRQKIRDSL